MKIIEIPITELRGSDRHHRFNLSDPAVQEKLRAAGLALDDRGQPRHPCLTWFDRERDMQVFEQGERA